jgi:hypothetical protein
VAVDDDAGRRDGVDGEEAGHADEAERDQEHRILLTGQGRAGQQHRENECEHRDVAHHHEVLQGNQHLAVLPGMAEEPE